MEWTSESGREHIMLRAIVYDEHWRSRWRGRGVEVARSKLPAWSGFVSVCNAFLPILLHYTFLTSVWRCERRDQCGREESSRPRQPGFPFTFITTRKSFSASVVLYTYTHLAEIPTNRNHASPRISLQYSYAMSPHVSRVFHCQSVRGSGCQSVDRQPVSPSVVSC